MQLNVSKMDDLLAKFGGDLRVASTPLSTSAPHPRLESYKEKDGFGDQQKRREKTIRMQKQRRKDYFDFARKIAEGELLSDSEEEEDEEGGMDTWGEDEVDGEMDTAKAPSKNNSKKKKPRKKYNPYRNQLMLSEWLVDAPADFAESWLCVVCPVGRRCMVVASRGWTGAYTRTGYCLRRFPSHLPGGSQKGGTAGKFSILDCIYDEVASVLYVLDFMAWNDHVFFDSDRECRYFFLESKFAENGDQLTQRSSSHPFVFRCLPQQSCGRRELEDRLAGGYEVAVDGLLFFHKLGHYKRNFSPLCTWLKPHMVPEILGIPVSQAFLDCSPALEKKEKKEKKVRKKDEEEGEKGMETDKKAASSLPVVEGAVGKVVGTKSGSSASSKRHIEMES